MSIKLCCQDFKWIVIIGRFSDVGTSVTTPHKPKTGFFHRKSLSSPFRLVFLWWSNFYGPRLDNKTTRCVTRNLIGRLTFGLTRKKKSPSSQLRSKRWSFRDISKGDDMRLKDLPILSVRLKSSSVNTKCKSSKLFTPSTSHLNSDTLERTFF